MVQHILIVEDEPDLVRMLEYNLRREGYQTRSAYSGQAALELVASGPVPDLILLDLMLPDMPGTEVCRQLRMDERTRSVLIVMLTAKSQETDRIVGFEIGADDYVVNAVQHPRAIAAYPRHPPSHPHGVAAASERDGVRAPAGG